MFNFFDNTPKSDKKSKTEKKDNFSKSKEILGSKDEKLEGFQMMGSKLSGAEYMTNKTELFDLEANKETMKNGFESLVALLPKKEGMKEMKKKEGMKEMKKKEGMGHHEDEDEEEKEEKESMKTLEGMVNIQMDKNTQIFAGGVTIIALLLVFKFMHKK